MKATICAVIVTHNSQKYLGKCIEALTGQTAPVERIIIIDSGSSDTSYLDFYSERDDIDIRRRSNIGFAAANNIGFSIASIGSDYTLFLNPDTFLALDFIEKAVALAEKNEVYGVITGVLYGFDLTREKPNDRIDSTGVFRKWYGKWYDRGQGIRISAADIPEAGSVPAACGALMFCRTAALTDELPMIFDESFFMYKEDIELSLRLRKKGWKIFYSPELSAWHCRGWDPVRKNMSRTARLRSSLNEIRMYRKHPSLYMIWALGKYALVTLFDW